MTFCLIMFMYKQSILKTFIYFIQLYVCITQLEEYKKKKIKKKCARACVCARLILLLLLLQLCRQNTLLLCNVHQYKHH